MKKEIKRFEVRRLAVKKFDARPIKRFGPPEPDIQEQLEQDIQNVEGTFDNTLETASAYYRAELDTDYYVCLVFQTHWQKEAFLKANGFEEGEKFLSGTLLAKKLGLTLPEGVQWKEGRPKEKWAALALTKDDYR